MKFLEIKNKLFTMLFEPDEDLPTKKTPEPSPSVISQVVKPVTPEQPIEDIIKKPVFINVNEEEKKIEKIPEPVIEVFEPYERKEILSPFHGVITPEIKTEEKPISKASKNRATSNRKDSILSPFYGYDDKAANINREKAKTLYKGRRTLSKEQTTKQKESAEA